MKLTVLHSTGKTAELEVSDQVFGTKVNKPLIAQAVRVYLSNQRQGTSQAKTRSEVARTKKKWFKQKGTGNARHGARSANIFVGGGAVHGPTGHENWTLNLSKKMKKLALASALTAQQENIIVTTMLTDIKAKTKDAHAYLQRLAPDVKRVLVVIDQKMDNILRGTSNLQYVEVTTAARMNIHELLLAQKIIMTKEAVHILEARVLGQKMETNNKPNEVIDLVVKKTESKKIKTEKEVIKKPVKKITKVKVATKKVKTETKKTE